MTITERAVPHAAPSLRLGRRLLLVCIPFALTLGCASPWTPPKCPSHGGDRWIELTTKHFVVVTDLDEKAAQAQAEGFETAYEQLRATAFPRSNDGPLFKVIVFADDDERHAFRPGGVGGEYMDRPSLEIERSPTIVLSAAPYSNYESEWRRLFLHELTHSLIAHTYGGVPTWLNEGLADYFSTLHVEDGKVTVGEVPSYYRLTPGFAPTVGELLSKDQSSFYARRQDSSIARDVRHRNYVGAWAFVHFLYDGPEPIRARFRAFLERLDAGDTTRDAWRKTLGAVPATDLESAFLTYLTANQWYALERPISLAPPGPVERERVLDDVDVHLLWAGLAPPGLTLPSPLSADWQIDEAAREAPRSAEVRYARGCLDLDRNEDVAAMREFEAALDVAPDDPRALYGALVAASRADRAYAVWSAEKRRGWVDRLAASAWSADELALLALLALQRGDMDEAMRRANAAVAADRGYSRALAVRAAVHFQAHRFADAVADQTRALALAPEQVDAGDLATTLRHYERVLAQGETAR